MLPITPLILVKSLVRSGERMLQSSSLTPVPGSAAAVSFVSSRLLVEASDSVSGAGALAVLPLRLLGPLEDLIFEAVVYLRPK